MAQKNYDQDDFLISSLVIQRTCCVLVLAYNTVEVVLLLQFLEASRVNGVYMASSIYPRQKECFISLLRARRRKAVKGQRLYIWLWLPYSTRYYYQFRYFCPAKNSKQTASSKQQEYVYKQLWTALDSATKCCSEGKGGMPASKSSWCCSIYCSGAMASKKTK